jgi:hypothetical protein
VALLVRWLDRPVAGALPPALRTMLAEPDVRDLNKLAAADLLRALGQPVDDEALAQAVSDPRSIALRALRVAVDASRRPPALANALDAVSKMPPAHVIGVIDDLTTAGDPGAAGLLAALTHHPDEDIAVSAVGAIEILRLSAACRLLSIAAASHPSEVVRVQAGLTLERLRTGTASRTLQHTDVPSTDESPGVAPEAPHQGEGADEDLGAQRAAAGGAHHAASESDSVADNGSDSGTSGARMPVRAFMSDADEEAGQFVVVARLGGVERASGRALYDVLTVHVHDADGVRRFAVAELVTAEDLRELLGEMAKGGVQLHRARAAEAAAALEQGSARTLLAGGAAMLGYLAWPAFIEGADAPADQCGPAADADG